MQLHVRRGTRDDLGALVALTLAEAREAEGIVADAERVRAGVLAGLEDPSVSAYWVVVSPDGEVVASASVVREWSDWRAGHYWWIQSMFVTPARRKLGLVSQLLRAIADEARSQNALELRLYVHRKNTAAIAAWERAGFRCAPYHLMRAPLEGVATQLGQEPT
jgi:GNAT superfamily N-acetyltransferase